MKRKTVSTPRRNRRQAPPRESKKNFSAWDWGLLRLWMVGIIFTGLWVALWGRAYYLQIIKGDELAEMARRQHQYTTTLAGGRGDILDRHGNVLAKSVMSSSIFVNPTKVKDKALTASVLGRILDLPTKQISQLLDQKKTFVWVERKVDVARGKQVQEARLPGVSIVSEYSRVYPYGTLAGQLLGFVNTDDKGIEGLELAYDDLLAGRTGEQVVERDASRRRMAGLEASIADLRGQNVRLTIDSQVQFFAEEALADSVKKFDASWGGCIVVDVPTGEILAWAQYPPFDPNGYQRSSQLVRRNRMATDALEQGSTMKSFLVAAALQENLVHAALKIDCEKGQWKVGKNIIHDTRSYDTLTVEKILHVSSNIGVSKIGFMLGKEKYWSYLNALGFGKPVNLPLAGQSKGILRPFKNWSDIDLAAASFGQGVAVTGVQMTDAYLQIAQDGPQTGLKLTLPEAPKSANTSMEQNEEVETAGNTSLEKDNRQDVTASAEAVAGNSGVFSPEIKRQIRHMLMQVVEEEGGTGKAARIPGLVAGGKTGTAQKADGSGRYGSGRVSSFVGMVPADSPQYLIVTIVDEPKKSSYGGVVAAPVFRHVALHTMAYHGHLPDTDDPLVQEIAKKNSSRPISVGTAGVPAANKAVEDHAADIAQIAVAQQVFYGKDVVPLLVGMEISEAVDILAKRGIMPVVHGNGLMVGGQTPKPGSAWHEAGSGMTLWLEDGKI